MRPFGRRGGRHRFSTVGKVYNLSPLVAALFFFICQHFSHGQQFGSAKSLPGQLSPAVYLQSVSSVYAATVDADGTRILILRSSNGGVTWNQTDSITLGIVPRKLSFFSISASLLGLIFERQSSGDSGDHAFVLQIRPDGTIVGDKTYNGASIPQAAHIVGASGFHTIAQNSDNVVLNDGGNLYCVLHTFVSSGSLNNGLFIHQSTDSGLTWSKLTRIDGDQLLDKYANPSLLKHQGYYHVIYTKRDSGGNSAVFCATTANLTASPWADIQRISSKTTACWAPTTAKVSAGILVCYTYQYSSADNDFYYLLKKAAGSGGWNEGPLDTNPNNTIWPVISSDGVLVSVSYTDRTSSHLDHIWGTVGASSISWGTGTRIDDGNVDDFERAAISGGEYSIVVWRNKSGSLRSNSNFQTTPCAYSISSSSASFSAGGGNGNVAVTASTGCSWSTSNPHTWITITSGSSGTGNGTVNYLVTANASSSPRSGNLTIAGQTFTVTQSGADSGAPSTTVIGWGYNGAGQISVPIGLSRVTAIAAGSYHALALKSEGTVVAWGDAGAPEVSVPSGLIGVRAIAAGHFHSLALQSNSTVVAWGLNDYGQVNIPPGLSGVVAIAGGHKHSLALKNDGTVVGWGFNNFGQATVPPGLDGVIAVAAGGFHSLALKNDGTVIGWGRNASGQASPPAGLIDVVAIAAGLTHSLALKRDGTVIGFGANTVGQRSPPSGMGRVVNIAAGQNHNLAVISDGSVVAWGYNTYGQASPPTNITAATGIAGGEDFSLAIIPTPPVLTITRRGSSLDLSWPVSAGNYVLQARQDFSTTQAWSDASVTTNVIGQEVRATFPASGPRRFFRLRH